MTKASYAAVLLAVCLQAAYGQDGTPLPLPADPETACGPAVTKQWSSEYPSCAKAILGGSITYEGTYDPGIAQLITLFKRDWTCVGVKYQTHAADDECCAGSVRYFGSGSTLGHANCFCDPSVWGRFDNAEFPIDIGMYFGVCTLKGYEIPVYEAGTGACSGAPYNTSAYSSTLIYEPEPLAPLKTLHEWLHDLHQDGLILTSFIVGIISAIGFGAALFVLAYNMVRSVMPSKYS